MTDTPRSPPPADALPHAQRSAAAARRGRGAHEASASVERAPVADKRPFTNASPPNVEGKVTRRSPETLATSPSSATAARDKMPSLDSFSRVASSTEATVVRRGDSHHSVILPGRRNDADASNDQGGATGVVSEPAPRRSPPLLSLAGNGSSNTVHTSGSPSASETVSRATSTALSTGAATPLITQKSSPKLLQRVSSIVAGGATGSFRAASEQHPLWSFPNAMLRQSSMQRESSVMSEFAREGTPVAARQSPVVLEEQLRSIASTPRSGDDHQSPSPRNTPAGSVSPLAAVDATFTALVSPPPQQSEGMPPDISDVVTRSASLAHSSTPHSIVAQQEMCHPSQQQEEAEANTHYSSARIPTNSTRGETIPQGGCSGKASPYHTAEVELPTTPTHLDVVDVPFVEVTLSIPHGYLGGGSAASSRNASRSASPSHRRGAPDDREMISCHLCGATAVTAREMQLHWILCEENSDAVMQKLLSHPLCSILAYPTHPMRHRVDGGDLTAVADRAAYNKIAIQILQDKVCWCRGCGTGHSMQNILDHLQHGCPRHLKQSPECPLSVDHNLTPAERDDEAVRDQELMLGQITAETHQRLLLGEFGWNDRRTDRHEHCSVRHAKASASMVQRATSKSKTPRRSSSPQGWRR
jgi:hypothetical protein